MHASRPSPSIHIGKLLVSLVMAAGALVLGVGETLAQLPQARLNSIFPLGGQRGTTVDITEISGTDLDEADELYFSHPGIMAAPKSNVTGGTPQAAPAPVTPGRRNRRKGELPNAQVIAGQFTVTIAPDVPVGLYDVRVKSAFGLSNPRTFAVGDRKEVIEVEPNTIEKPMPVELNTVINGRCNGGTDIDYFKFSAKGGQRILADCRASRVETRMNPVLELYNAAGRRVAYNHRHPLGDALLDYMIPADGEYVLKVFDFVYSGGAEYGYRLALHTGPHIDFVMPSSGQPGTTAEYTLYGRNLPVGQPSSMKSNGRALEQLKVQITLPADTSSTRPAEVLSASQAAVDGFSYTLSSPAGSSNPVTIYFSNTPTSVEQEPNDLPENAQKLTVPVEVSGQFQVRADTDRFAFDAKAGDVYWIEAFGERNGSTSDPYFVVEQIGKKNDKGEETITRLTSVDDNPLNVGGTQFVTTTDDPVFRFAAPADGTYRIVLRDRYFESRGDADLTYRLAIRKEAPDVRLAVLPPCPTADAALLMSTWSLGLRKGDNASLNVMAFRRDGFNGPVDISVEGLPAGVTTPGGTIGPGQNAATIVLSSTEQAEEWTGPIRVVGKIRNEDPAAVKAVADAQAAQKAASDALPALTKAMVDTAAAEKGAADKATAAKAALDKDAQNAALIKAKADADAAAATAAAAAKAALDAKAAGDKKVADAVVAVAAAQSAREKSAKEVIQEARGGTIVWNGTAGTPAPSRVTRSIMLSVLDEIAPYQLTSTVTGRIEANQGRQILIPVKLLKRAGFDADVNLTFPTPPQNIQVENKPIKKGATDEVYRVFVQNNAAVGTYTLYLQSAVPVEYSRHPEAAALAVKAKEAAEKALAEATEAVKKGNEAKAAGDKKVAQTAALAKQKTDAKVVADKAVVETAAAAKLAADEKTKSDKLAADTDTAAKAAVAEKAAADKLAADTDAAAKAASAKVAEAKAAAEKAPADKALGDAKAAAEKEAAVAADAAKKAVDAKVVVDKKAVDTADAAKKAADAKALADKKAVDTADVAKKAADAKALAEKAVAEAAAAAQAAVAEKAAADKLAVELTQKMQAATAAKAAADKRAVDTANVAKPKATPTAVPSPSITINVKPAPGTLAAAPAAGGAVKRGATLEIKVTVNRTNGFTGPVTLGLPLPPNVVGLTAAPVTVPADKNEGTLTVQVAADATMGTLPNMVVRGAMEFNGQAEIDQPVTINVTQ